MGRDGAGWIPDAETLESKWASPESDSWEARKGRCFKPPTPAFYVFSLRGKSSPSPSRQAMCVCTLGRGLLLGGVGGVPAYVCCVHACVCTCIHCVCICALDTHQCAGVDGILVSLATGRKGLESWPLSWPRLVGMFCHRDSAQKVPSSTRRKQKLKLNIWLLKIRPLINQGGREGCECRPGKN